MSEKPQMNSELGRIYNDHMEEAHGGYPGQYTTEERKRQVLDLLEKGKLSQGIDLYHAALLLTEDGGSPEDKARAYDLYIQAGKLGYPGGFHQAAMMYDSKLIASGQPQKYGTHWTSEVGANGAAIPKPLEDPDRVDQWRAEFGLPPLAQEAVRVGEMYLKMRKLSKPGK